MRSLASDAPATRRAIPGRYRGVRSVGQPGRCLGSGAGRPSHVAALFGVFGDAKVFPQDHRPESRRRQTLFRMVAPPRARRRRPLAAPVGPRRRGAPSPCSPPRSSGPCSNRSRTAPAPHWPMSVSTRDDALLELLYGSGLRVAELCGLGLGDLDLKNRSVTVWGKGGKQRRVPMSCPAAEALGRYLASGRGRARERLDSLGRPVRQSARQADDLQGRAPRAGPALAGTDPSPRAAPHLCDSSRRRRGGPACRAGTAGARQLEDDGDLHPRVHRSTGRSVPKRSSESLMTQTGTDRLQTVEELWADFKSTADQSRATGSSFTTRRS